MLIKERDANLRAMEEAVDAFSFEDRRAYANYLAQTYYYTSHSVPLLGAMIARTPTGGALFDYCVNAVKEELHHEKLAHADLVLLGFELEEFPELSSCRCLWEPQFYKVEHRGAEVVAGYIFMLESLAVTRGRQMRDRAGSNGGTSFFAVHAAKDEEHARTVAKQIAAFGDAHQGLVMENMRQTAFSYIARLREITAQS